METLFKQYNIINISLKAAFRNMFKGGLNKYYQAKKIKN